MMTKTNETGAGMGIEIVMPREGGPEVLEVARRDAPRRPKAGEAVVRVEATGVSFAEVQMLKGRYFMQPKFPFVPGYDLVGEVESVGEGVDGRLVGQRVAALTETGSWAERVALDAKNLAPVPDGLDSADAVAAVTNGVTAWQMIHRAASVRPGQTVHEHGLPGRRGDAARAARQARRRRGHRHRLGLQTRDGAGSRCHPRRLQERERAGEGA